MVSDPVPEISSALKSSVPEVTSIVPLLVTSGTIVLTPVPPVFSNRPVFLIYEAVELPRPIPLSSTMS